MPSHFYLLQCLDALLFYFSHLDLKYPWNAVGAFYEVGMGGQDKFFFHMGI